MKTDKRYRIGIDMYLFAKSESGAIRESAKLLKRLKRKYTDSQALIIELYEAPFASIKGKQII